ncbi:MAG: hypothetical protein KAH54_01925 [Candidatus Sabulitectum sp.]|nr:hypothetical protein [Candidatus Sabulitectum sp.]
MRIIAFLLVLPAILFAASFSDDFESYTPPVDLGNSSDWFHLDPSGNLLVTEEAGNNFVESEWDGNEAIAYLCMGSVILLDGEISSDVKFSGNNTIIGLMTRISASSGECYFGGIFPLYPPIGATVIGHINSSGEYTILSNDYFYPMDEDTWYNISLEVTGTTQVELGLSIDGTVNSSCTDSTYLIQEGFAGLASMYQNAEPMTCYDNFSVVDYGAALTATTFGGIKALFR